MSDQNVTTVSTPVKLTAGQRAIISRLEAGEHIDIVFINRRYQYVDKFHKVVSKRVISGLLALGIIDRNVTGPNKGLFLTTKPPTPGVSDEPERYEVRATGHGKWHGGETTTVFVANEELARLEVTHFQDLGWRHVTFYRYGMPHVDTAEQGADQMAVYHDRRSAHATRDGAARDNGTVAT